MVPSGRYLSYKVDTTIMVSIGAKLGPAYAGCAEVPKRDKSQQFTMRRLNNMEGMICFVF